MSLVVVAAVPVLIVADVAGVPPRVYAISVNLLPILPHIPAELACLAIVALAIITAQLLTIMADVGAIVVDLSKILTAIALIVAHLSPILVVVMMIVRK